MIEINKQMDYNVINWRGGNDLNNFKINIKGQVNTVSLPDYKALWPLFETIVNSIQSLEDSVNAKNGEITIIANRTSERQFDLNGKEEITPFYEFEVIDNGNGFDDINYNSFLEAYSSLKIEKGCKGIGRFLWLKAFSNVHIKSVFNLNNEWYKREFDFTADKGIEPEDNSALTDERNLLTRVKLTNFAYKYRVKAPISLELLGRKIIEHCLPYFLNYNCPKIILVDNFDDKINLNDYFEKNIKDSLHQDKFVLNNEEFVLYHIQMQDGIKKHELHFCANNREVKSYELNKYIPDLQKKIVAEDEKSFYYVGYLMGSYLDDKVNMNRTSFDFEDEDTDMINTISGKELVESAKEYIMAYLVDDLEKINKEKCEYINTFVKKEKPQYRYLLNKKPELYKTIPANLSKDKLELELHKAAQEWEAEIHKQAKEIDKKVKSGDFNQEDFDKIFNEYCSSVTDISKASLSEYVIRRKAILELLEKSLERRDDNKYNSEASIHSIICPMRHTSDDVAFEEMNLWLIDDRLSYHQFLASDKQMKSLPVLETDVDKRMDIAVFDQAISFSAEKDRFNSISIIELKKPNRNDLKDDDKNPINQVLGYVNDIRNGKVKKANGRDFGNVTNTAFYCYVIADMTESLKLDAENASLTLTPDGEGYYGYNQPRGAYIEVISYDKMVRDAAQRNQILFDKLFCPGIKEILNSKLLVS